MKPPTDSEFYVGYDPAIPAGIARHVRRTLAVLAFAGLLILVFLLAVLRPLPTGTFAYGHPRVFEGRIVATPYPALLENEQDPVRVRRSWLLVGPGKHGAPPEIAAADGRWVRLRGTTISRRGVGMIEVVPGSVVSMKAAAENVRLALDMARPERVVGTRTLEGEIVDGKCFLGVMNPGEGTVHRECARRCISGGVPPMLAVRTSRDGVVLYRLVDSTGVAAGRDLLPVVGRPVRVDGVVSRTGDDWVLAADASAFRVLTPASR